MLVAGPVLQTPVVWGPVVGDPVVWHQIGPNPRPYQPSDLPIPRRRKAEDSVTPSAPAPAAAALPAAQRSRFAQCLTAGTQDPTAGLAAARAWLAENQDKPAPHAARGAAAQCLGQLLAQQGDYPAAAAAFAESVSQVPSNDTATAASLQAMAGNAALAGGDAAGALAWFDKALAAPPIQSPATNANEALGAVQIDRSRALAALGSLPEAGTALEEAHRLAPNDPEGWLLSATLARRAKDLERAQRDIEVAARLEPPGGALASAIGLEAGVIAVLGGREDAARKSWESVLALGPESAEAKAARGYLDQLGPDQPSPAQPSPAPAPPASLPETPR